MNGRMGRFVGQIALDIANTLFVAVVLLSALTASLAAFFGVVYVAGVALHQWVVPGDKWTSGYLVLMAALLGYVLVGFAHSLYIVTRDWLRERWQEAER